MQQNVAYNTQNGKMVSQAKQKGKIMSEFEKQYQEFEAQVKKIQEFWVNAFITSLKQFTK